MRNKRRTQKKVAGRGSGSRRKNEKKDVQHTNLKERTKEFALRIIEFVETLPRGRTTDVIRG